MMYERDKLENIVLINIFRVFVQALFSYILKKGNTDYALKNLNNLCSYFIILRNHRLCLSC